jgi:hypothetical protein
LSPGIGLVFSRLCSISLIRPSFHFTDRIVRGSRGASRSIGISGRSSPSELRHVSRSPQTISSNIAPYRSVSST